LFFVDVGRKPAQENGSALGGQSTGFVVRAASEIARPFPKVPQQNFPLLSHTPASRQPDPL
jgi:hypothetical protein